MYTTTLLSKHGQYTSHICDHWWPPAHPQHNITNNNRNNKINEDNSKNTKISSTATTTTTTITCNPSTTANRLGDGPKQWVASFGPKVSFFFPSLFFFLILNIIYRYYRHIEGTEGLREGGGNVNRPKRRQTHCLGNWWVFFFFLSVFFTSTY